MEAKIWVDISQKETSDQQASEKMLNSLITKKIQIKPGAGGSHL
jgi:hypothetical protein